VLVVFAAALVGAVVWFVTQQSDASMVRDLPPAERAKVAERAVSNLRDVCQRADRPREFCREQAQIVVGLPECDGACRALAQGELAADTAVR
jgi:hypothetical protein